MLFIAFAATTGLPCIAPLCTYRPTPPVNTSVAQLLPTAKPSDNSSYVSKVIYGEDNDCDGRLGTVSGAFGAADVVNGEAWMFYQFPAVPEDGDVTAPQFLEPRCVAGGQRCDYNAIPPNGANACRLPTGTILGEYCNTNCPFSPDRRITFFSRMGELPTRDRYDSTSRAGHNMTDSKKFCRRFDRSPFIVYVAAHFQGTLAAGESVPFATDFSMQVQSDAFATIFDVCSHVPCKQNETTCLW